MQELRDAAAHYAAGNTPLGDAHFEAAIPLMLPIVRHSVRQQMRNTEHWPFTDEAVNIALTRVWQDAKRGIATDIRRKGMCSAYDVMIRESRRNAHFTAHSAFRSDDDDTGSAGEADTLPRHFHTMIATPSHESSVEAQAMIDRLADAAAAQRPIWGDIIRAYASGHHSWNDVAAALGHNPAKIRRNVRAMRRHPDLHAFATEAA